MVGGVPWEHEVSSESCLINMKSTTFIFGAPLEHEVFWGSDCQRLYFNVPHTSIARLSEVNL